MSIIEQAARRLEQLRRAGVDVPVNTATGESHAGVARNGSDSVPVRLTKELGEHGIVSSAGSSPRPSALSPASEPEGGEAASGHDAGIADESARAWPVAGHATIDLGRLEASGYMTPQTPRSRLAEQFRVIKRPLLTNARGKPGASVANANRIMVTSALPSEGKTFIALNLAMSLAMELDTRVLLVDADTSRPAIPDRLGVAPSKGLLDVLVDPALPLDSVILSTNVDRLSLLLAGTQNSRATELLASEAMNHLVDRLSSVDPALIVLFDTPPLLATTEARVLAAHMGQVVLVVAADDTTQATVNEALATVEACPLAMTLLNRSTGTETRRYYGSYGQ